MKFVFWHLFAIQISHDTAKHLLRMINFILFQSKLLHDFYALFFQVTEFAEEGDLLNKIKTARTARRYFSEDVIWIYFIQMCRAIAFLHKQNVLHRVCLSFCLSIRLFLRISKAQMFFYLLEEL